MVERVPTFVEGFDPVLDGGVPRGSVVLVCGTPGTMKTSLVFSILYHNVKERDGRALYVTLEEGYEDVVLAMEDLGMGGVDDMELFVLDVGRIRQEHEEDEGSAMWLQLLEEYIEKRVQLQGFDLLAIDSLSGLYALSELTNPRRELFRFFSFLRGLGTTTFLISEIPFHTNRLVPHEEDFLADGILLLRYVEVGDSDVQLRIRCVKMRRTKHDHNYYAFVRGEDRFRVTSVIARRGRGSPREELSASW